MGLTQLISRSQPGWTLNLEVPRKVLHLSSLRLLTKIPYLAVSGLRSPFLCWLEATRIPSHTGLLRFQTSSGASNPLMPQTSLISFYVTSWRTLLAFKGLMWLDHLPSSTAPNLSFVFVKVHWKIPFSQEYKNSISQDYIIFTDSIHIQKGRDYTRARVIQGHSENPTYHTLQLKWKQVSIPLWSLIKAL